MKLLLKRIAKKSNYTIGNLYVDGEWICNTIEDTDRGLTQLTPLSTIKSRKVPSKTAIPTGTYTITMNVISPRFSKKEYYLKYCGGRVPRLLNVPGYEGILIHRGATEKDSAGCIIVGYNRVVGKVLDSQAAFEKLYTILKSAKDKITIEIV